MSLKEMFKEEEKEVTYEELIKKMNQNKEVDLNKKIKLERYNFDSKEEILKKKDRDRKRIDTIKKFVKDEEIQLDIKTEYNTALKALYTISKKNLISNATLSLKDLFYLICGKFELKTKFGGSVSNFQLVYEIEVNKQ